jgi:hypothetical protein
LRELRTVIRQQMTQHLGSTTKGNAVFGHLLERLRS